MNDTCLRGRVVYDARPIKIRKKDETDGRPLRLSRYAASIKSPRNETAE